MVYSCSVPQCSVAVNSLRSRGFAAVLREKVKDVEKSGSVLVLDGMCGGSYSGGLNVRLPCNEKPVCAFTDGALQYGHTKEA